MRDDAGVASALEIPVERLVRLQRERSLTNDDICTIPASLLARAQRRVDRPKPDHPGEWAKQRARELSDDSGAIAPNGLERAMAQRQQILAATRQRHDGLAVPSLAGLDTTRWTAIGPNNVPGRTRAIAVHPSDGNRIWVGTVAGGIWYTSDGGSSWRAVNDFAANLAITSIVIDPVNTDLLYASTGEGFFNADSIKGGGVYKSLDGGQTWIRLSATDPSSDSNWNYVNRLAVHPTSSGIVLSANRDAGVFRSADGGTTWTRVLATSGSYPYAYQVQFDPNDGSKAVAGLGQGKVAYSTDAGASWTTTTIVSTSDFSGRVEIAYAKATPSMLYASIQTSSSTSSIYRSTNDGASWSLLSSPGHLGSQGWYDNTIWVDPTDSNTVVVGGIDLYRSTNGGSSFTRISNWAAWPSSPHADQHVMAHHPSYNGSTNRIVFVGNDGGVWKSTNIASASSSSDTSTNTWSSISTGIQSTQFYGGAASADGTIIAGGTQDNGSLYSTNVSTTWGRYTDGDGGYAAIDQTNASYIYGEYVYASIRRSADGGLSEEFICSGIDDNADYCGGTVTAANFIAPFVLDPNSQSRMLVGANRLWISDNVKAATPSWRSAKSAVSSAGYISAVAVATGNSDIIWVGHNNGNVYKTSNGTATSPTWTAATVGPSRQVMRILIDPSDSNTVYVAFGGYSSGNIQKTTNGGSSWTDISSGLPQVPVRGIARHPTNASWIYLGTEVGVFTTEDGGVTWSTTNDGPGAVSVDEIFFVGSTSTLVAATHGRGMFQATVASSGSTATPETGWWWYASESGRGFSVEVSGNNLFMAGYLYSTNGKPIWYISQGARASNGVYQGSLLQYSDGQTLAGSYQSVSFVGSVGSVTLSFDTTTTGRLTWSGGTIPITRYEIVSGGVALGPSSGMPQKGWWWNSAESGRGYFLEVQGSTLFLAAYMYDSSGQAVWYISQGAMTSTSLYSGSLTEFRGGQTLGGTYNGPTSSSDVGSITIQFSSQTTATMTLPNGNQVALTRYTF